MHAAGRSVHRFVDILPVSTKKGRNGIFPLATIRVLTPPAFHV
jgi:hypothetical protein